MIKPFLYLEARTLKPYWISPGDTVKLAPIAVPSDGVENSVFLEVWDPKGAQPFNSHPDAVESFFFLAGEGLAMSDGAEKRVSAGGFLVLGKGTNHRIVNLGKSKMFAITTMMPDNGFADLVLSGTPAEWDSEDLAFFSERKFA
jgi:mannose-6-phosphate isomerase-like protein (cupin superfamily)